MKALLSTDDVAAITGLSAYTIRAAVRAGELRGAKLRGRIRVHPDDLRAWIDENAMQPPAFRMPPVASQRSRSPGARASDMGRARELKRVRNAEMLDEMERGGR